MKTQPFCTSQLRKVTKCSFIILLMIFLTACGLEQQPGNEETESVPVEQTEIASSEEATQEELAGETITIRSIGDILIHDTVYYDAATADGYDFSHMFEPVREYIGNADITTANLETLAAASELGISNYPLFNAPEEIIDELKSLGVDIVNNATNHTMDFGSQGAHASIEALQARDMMYVGSYDSWQDYNSPRIIEVNGIKVGFLSYSYGANGNYIPEDESYLLSLIDTELIPLEIELLNTQVDVSIVMFHNGIDSVLPTEDQLSVMQIARDAGANFVLGGHPHILQPFVYYNESQAGIFSHGNFLSGQYLLEEKLGGIVEYTFRKSASGDITLDGMRFMPTYNFGLPEQANYLVIPLADGADYGLADADYLYNMISERMSYFTDKVEVVDYLD